MAREKSPDAPAAHKAFSRRQIVAAAIIATGAPVTASAQTRVGENDKPEPGTIWWGELLSRDPAKARSFYSKVVGWTPKTTSLEDSTRPPNPGEKEYTLFTIEGHDAAGAMAIQDANFAQSGSPLWLLYVQVPSVDKALGKALELGGKLLNGPYDVPNVGRIVVIEDPEGAKLGLVTLKPAG